MLVFVEFANEWAIKFSRTIKNISNILKVFRNIQKRISNFCMNKYKIHTVIHKVSHAHVSWRLKLKSSCRNGVKPKCLLRKIVILDVSN
jgi:hypothetical protein